MANWSHGTIGNESMKNTKNSGTNGASQSKIAVDPPLPHKQGWPEWGMDSSWGNRPNPLSDPPLPHGGQICPKRVHLLLDLPSRWDGEFLPFCRFLPWPHLIHICSIATMLIQQPTENFWNKPPYVMENLIVQSTIELHGCIPDIERNEPSKFHSDLSMSHCLKNSTFSQM